jgi:hypothetical protein
LKPRTGLDQHLELVVGLEHVVQVFHLPVFGFWASFPRFSSAIAAP